MASSTALWSESGSLSSSSSPEEVGWLDQPAVALTCMILVPILTSAVYVIDKVAIARRVQYTSSYISVVGAFDILLGVLLLPATNWAGADLVAKDFVWPVLAGVTFGIATMFYVFALEGADVSRVVGLENTYPLLVTLLSWLVLDDVLTPMAYVGVAITCIGAVLLSIDPGPVIYEWFVENFGKKRNTKRYTEKSPLAINEDRDEEQPVPVSESETEGKSKLMEPGEAEKAPLHEERSKLGTMLIVIPLVVSLGVSEFFTKLSTGSMPALGVSAISYAIYGFVMFMIIVTPESRKHWIFEAKRNWMWPIFSELFMIGSNITLALAMSSLSAPVVSSVAASAPLFTLLLEFVFQVADDTCFTFAVYKLIPISVTVAGVVLLSLEVASG